MSFDFNMFIVFRHFHQELKRNIKKFHVFDNNVAYCVTKDDMVYGLGGETKHSKGFNENYSMKWDIINELCDQNIEEFFVGNRCMFARTQNNEIYSWGWNGFGQLGRGTETNEIRRPKLFKFFKGKNIIQICTGSCYYHCVALSMEGVVYGWADNCIGQINPKLKDKVILNPIIITNTTNEIIKSIHCSDSNFHWLTFNGNIYCFDSHKFMDFKIDEKIFDISYVKQSIVFQTKDWVYFRGKDNEDFSKSEHKNLFSYFLATKRKTHKTIHLENGIIYSIDYDLLEESSTFIKTMKIIYFDEEICFKNVFNDLSHTQRSKVKCFHKSQNFEFLVMNNNEVYVYGSNDLGKLGLGDLEQCDDLTLVPQLSNINIEEFYEGHPVMFARSQTNQIYSWGTTGCFLLGREVGPESRKVLPQLIDKFEGKDIISISCGSLHCLALSSRGLLYGWGHNSKGQVGCEQEQYHVETPTVIDIKYGIENAVKFFYASLLSSYAVDINGNAYFWGQTYEKYQEKRWKTKFEWLNKKFKNYYQFKPKKLNVDEVTQIQMIEMLNGRNECIVLRESGNVHVYSLGQNKLISKINIGVKIDSISVDDYYFLLKSEECVYTFDIEKSIPTKTNFTNFYDYFSVKHNSYQKTIQIKSNIDEESYEQAIKYLMTKEILIENNGIGNNTLLKLKDKNVFNTKFKSLFEICNEIGTGNFGKVYRVKSKISGDIFAIKIFEMNDKENQEISDLLISKMDSNFVVKYVDSWNEANVDQNGLIKKQIFLQMELCQTNLRFLVSNLMNKYFEDKIQIFLYYISCEIFKELIECVNYLHLNKIMHRDLKPENILITDGTNKRFIKLCDFGLAKQHEVSQHTQNVGTLSYMAPEIRVGKQYNLKSDVYSLALIGTEIFNFGESVASIRDQKDLSQHMLPYLKSNIERKFRKLLDLLESILIPKDYQLRPDCNQILNKYNEFSIKKIDVIDDNNLSYFSEILDIPENNILKNIFESKI